MNFYGRDYKEIIHKLFEENANMEVIKRMSRERCTSYILTLNSRERWMYSCEARFHVAEHAEHATFAVAELENIAGIEICIYQESEDRAKYGNRTWPRTMVASAYLSAEFQTIFTRVFKLPRFSDQAIDRQLSQIFRHASDVWAGTAEIITTIFAVALGINFDKGDFGVMPMMDRLKVLQIQYKTLATQHAIFFGQRIRPRTSLSYRFKLDRQIQQVLTGTVVCREFKEVQQPTGSTRREILLTKIKFSVPETRRALYMVGLLGYYEDSFDRYRPILEFSRRWSIVDARDTSLHSKVVLVLKSFYLLRELLKMFRGQDDTALHCLRRGILLQSTSSAAAVLSSRPFFETTNEKLPPDLPAEPSMGMAFEAVQTSNLVEFQKAVQTMQPLSFTQATTDGKSLLELIATHNMPSSAHENCVEWVLVRQGMVQALHRHGCYLNVLLEHHPDPSDLSKVVLVTFLSLWDFYCQQWGVAGHKCVKDARQFFLRLGAVGTPLEIIGRTNTLDATQKEVWKNSVQEASV